MADKPERDENFTSEDEYASIEEGLTGPRLWCGVFAGQLARIELTVKTHPDLDQNARDRIAVRMTEMVRELAVEAGAREPGTPTVALEDIPVRDDGLAGHDQEETGA